MFRPGPDPRRVLLEPAVAPKTEAFLVPHPRFGLAGALNSPLNPLVREFE